MLYIIWALWIQKRKRRNIITAFSTSERFNSRMIIYDRISMRRVYLISSVSKINEILTASKCVRVSASRFYAFDNIAGMQYHCNLNRRTTHMFSWAIRAIVQRRRVYVYRFRVSALGCRPNAVGTQVVPYDASRPVRT